MSTLNKLLKISEEIGNKVEITETTDPDKALFLLKNENISISEKDIQEVGYHHNFTFHYSDERGYFIDEIGIIKLEEASRIHFLINVIKYIKSKN